MSKWQRLTRRELKTKTSEELQQIARDALKASQQQMNRLKEGGYKLSDEQVNLLREFGKNGKLTMEKVSNPLEDIMAMRQVLLDQRSTITGRKQEEKWALETIGRYYETQGEEFKFSKIGKNSYSVMTGYDENGRAIKTEWSREDISDFWDLLHDIGQIADVIYDEMFAQTVEVFTQNKDDMSLNAMKVKLQEYRDQIYIQKKRGY